LSAFGLRPRATLELPGPIARLERILDLLRACPYSFHDLSRVQLVARVPRFNMPFELGLAVAAASTRKHQWFVFEARHYRLQRTLSDLNGQDPYVHFERPRRLLTQLSNALVRAQRQPTFDDLNAVYRVLRAAAAPLRQRYGTVFEAAPFKELVVLAAQYVSERLNRL